MIPIKYSQNYFKNPNLVKELIHNSNISNIDVVIEIGPGKGAITKNLLLVSKKVIGIELDHENVFYLNKNFDHHIKKGQLIVLEKDFLKWDLPTFSYKVFSNIPFFLTAEIIRKLYGFHPNLPESSYLILQKEAAEMYRDLSNLKSILIGADNLVTIRRSIPRTEFKPVPNIDASFMEIKKLDVPIYGNRFSRRLFRDFIIFMYTNSNSLSKNLNFIFSHTQLKHIQNDLNVDIKNIQPSKITIIQWQHLFTIFRSLVGEGKKNIVQGAELRLEKKRKGNPEKRTRRFLVVNRSRTRAKDFQF